MKKIPFYTVVFFAAFSLMSCATMSYMQEVSNADYGEYPEHYKVIVEDYMNSILGDLYKSANYSNWKGPSQTASGYWFDKKEFGYKVCVDINAKNRMDGYAETFYFFIKDGRVLQKINESSGSPNMCKYLR